MAGTEKAARVATRASKARWSRYTGWPGWVGKGVRRPAPQRTLTLDSFTHLPLHPTFSMISATEYHVVQPRAQGLFRGSRWTENRKPLKPTVMGAGARGLITWPAWGGLRRKAGMQKWDE